MERSTLLTIEVYDVLGRASREKLAGILQDCLEKFLGTAVDVHSGGTVPLTGHRTSDGSTYALNLHPHQLLTMEETTYYLKDGEGRALMGEPHSGTRIEMYSQNGLFTVTVRETLDEVRAKLEA
jgi:hypothetical protein